jgi:hypothetical protein
MFAYSSGSHEMTSDALRVTLCAAVALGMGSARADLPAYQYEALAYRGASAPGGGTLQGTFKPGAVGNAGEVAYVAGVDASGADGLFLDTGAGVDAIASPGAEAADGWQFAEEPGVIGGIGAPVSMNSAGDLVFAADLVRGDQTGAGTFLWKQDTGMLTAVALPGQAAPGAGVFGNARSHPGIADNGDVVFAAEVTPPGGEEGEGVFLLSQGRITPVAQPGDPEPDGGTLVRAAHPSVNNQGLIAFEAEVTRAGGSATGLFLRSATGLTWVAGAGTPAPEGGVFRNVEAPRLNNRGDLVFFGDTGEWAVYLARAGNLTRLVGPGTALPAGARVGTLVTGEGSLALNQEGAVALTLRPANTAAAGIFLDEAGALWPAALPGTILAGVGPLDDVGPDLALNDHGQVAFQADLAGGMTALVLASSLPSGLPN